MLTRCPHCQTCFRVTAEQLKVRQGRVRCGACREIFDALDSLRDEISVLVPNPAADTESLRSRDGTTEPLATMVTVESIPEAANETLEPEPEPEPEPEKPAESEPAEEKFAAVLPAPAPSRRWPWLVGIGVMLLLAAGQSVYIFRSELAVALPELRPVLATGCEVFGCALPRPLRPDLVGIETSDLAPHGDNLLLTALLRNRAPFDQDYPHLELTLTDTQDAALVRKVLAPADWLPVGQDPARGFAAGGEVAVRLTLTTEQVQAVGYRLYLFYP